MKDLTDFIRYLETEKDQSLQNAAGLQTQDRGDEANLAKIRANVFDVFAVVSGMARAKYPQRAPAFIQEKIGDISRPWREALAAAQAHGDFRKVAAEEVKLEAAGEIERAFDALMGERA